MRSSTPGATSNIVVGAASARVKLVESSSPQQVRICNDGTATVWLAFGDSTVTAAAASGIPVTAGAIEVVTIPGAATHVAAIAAGATGTIYFTVGAGL